MIRGAPPLETETQAPTAIEDAGCLYALVDAAWRREERRPAEAESPPAWNEIAIRLAGRASPLVSHGIECYRAVRRYVSGLAVHAPSRSSFAPPACPSRSNTAQSGGTADQDAQHFITRGRESSRDVERQAAKLKLT